MLLLLTLAAHKGLTIVTFTARCANARSLGVPHVPGLPLGGEEPRAGREEWRGPRVGPAGDHLGPLERRPSCGGAGGGGFGEGAASGRGGA
jgi:hypothetical protein